MDSQKGVATLLGFIEIRFIRYETTHTNETLRPKLKRHEDALRDFPDTRDPVLACLNEPESRVVLRMADHYREVVSHIPTPVQTRANKLRANALALPVRKDRHRSQAHARNPRVRRNTYAAEGNVAHNAITVCSYEGDNQLPPSAQAIDQARFGWGFKSLLIEAPYPINVLGLLEPDHGHSGTLPSLPSGLPFQWPMKASCPSAGGCALQTLRSWREPPVSL